MGKSYYNIIRTFSFLEKVNFFSTKMNFFKECLGSLRVFGTKVGKSSLFSQCHQLIQMSIIFLWKVGNTVKLSSAVKRQWYLDDMPKAKQKDKITNFTMQKLNLRMNLAKLQAMILHYWSLNMSSWSWRLIMIPNTSIARS